MKVVLASMMLIGSISAFSQSKLTIDVTLNPAGSFQASTQNIEGKITKKGDVIIADKIVIDINSLKTGIDLRDEHLWKHLNYKKFQKAILTDFKGQAGKGTGTVEVAGVKRPVSIKYKEENNKILADFKLNTSDFSLPEVEYMGIGVEKEIIGKVIMQL